MSLSRDFSKFGANLRYGDLPPAVIDRAKGVILQGLTSALVAHDMQPVASGLAISPEQYDALIDTCRHLDKVDGAAAKLIALTVPG